MSEPREGRRFPGENASRSALPVESDFVAGKEESGQFDLFYNIFHSLFGREALFSGYICRQCSWPFRLFDSPKRS